MRRVLAAMAAASWLAACAGNNSTPPGPQQFEQAQKPVSPKSSIVGRVIDASSRQPLEGVTAKIVGLDGAQTSGADGSFRFDGIVAGSDVIITLEKAGFVRGKVSGSTPSSAGNSPLEGAVTTVAAELYPAVCAVTGSLFLPNGKPVAGVTLTVDQRNLGESVVSSQTAMDGSFLLSGLGCTTQGTTQSIRAPAFDENGDMQADYAAVKLNVVVTPGIARRVFITYSAPANRVVASEHRQRAARSRRGPAVHRRAAVRHHAAESGGVRSGRAPERYA